MELRDKVFNNFFRSNKLFLISIICYLLITIPLMLNHVPWYDEAHGWIVAQSMNFSNWQDIVRAEGHPLLWFILIMPFAKFNIAYPYPMLFINYITCLAAIILMWKKAPFNNLLKVTITFSSMFILYFPIVARGYSLGILLLFTLASLYKKQLDKPILYAVLIGLILNLNIICGIAASWFGLVFFIKFLNKKIYNIKGIVSVLILIVSVLFFVFPFIGGIGTEASVQDSNGGLSNLIKFFEYCYFYYFISFVCAFGFIMFKTKCNIEKTFYLYVSIIMFILFKYFYIGYGHHFIFFFIYLVIMLWILNDVAEEKVYKPCLSRPLDILNVFLILVFMFPIQVHIPYVYHGNVLKARELANIMNSDSKFNDCDLFLTEKDSLIVPYLHKGINSYDICTLKPVSWNTFYSRTCESSDSLFNDIKKDTYILTFFELPGYNYYQCGSERLYFIPKKGEN